MKILCDRQQLQEAFNVVGGIPPVKTPRPVLQHVLLQAEDDDLTLFATDLQLSAAVRVDSVKVEKPGRALVPAREAAALLKELTDPTITITAEDHRSTLQSGAGSFVLLGADPSEFPKLPDPGEAVELHVSAGRFLDMVRKTQFAAAREETRYAINGVLLEHTGGTLRLVSTDGRRLALIHEETGDPANECRAVVPLQIFQTLARAIGDDEDSELTIQVGTNQIGFREDSVTLVSRLLDNRFPDYEAVIPKASETTVEIDRAMLERNLRKVAILSRGEVRMVRFDFSGSGLQLSAESSGVGRGEITMDADVKGAGGVISFNPDYLLDALKVADREVVRIDMVDETTPARITMGEAYTYVLMPISGS